MDSFLDLPDLSQSLHYLLHGIPETACRNGINTPPNHVFSVRRANNAAVSGDCGGTTAEHLKEAWHGPIAVEQVPTTTNFSSTLTESTPVWFDFRRGGKQVYAAKLTAHRRRHSRPPLQERQAGSPLPPTDSDYALGKADVPYKSTLSRIASSSPSYPTETATKSDAQEVYRLLVSNADDADHLWSDNDTSDRSTSHNVGICSTNVGGMVIVAADEDCSGKYHEKSQSGVASVPTATHTTGSSSRTSTTQRSPKANQRSKSTRCKIRRCRKVVWCPTKVLCEAHYQNLGALTSRRRGQPTKRKRCAFPSCRRYAFLHEGKTFCRYHDTL